MSACWRGWAGRRATAWPTASGTPSLGGRTGVSRNSVCPLCRSGSPREFLRREQVPVHQNLLCATQAEARGAARAALYMAVCLTCGFVFNTEFDGARLSYGPSYDNRQDCSPAFERHVEQLVRRVVEHHGVRDARIVEIGCGNGAFLRRLATYPATHNRGIGYDPSYTGPDA